MLSIVLQQEHDKFFNNNVLQFAMKGINEINKLTIITNYHYLIKPIDLNGKYIIK